MTKRMQDLITADLFCGMGGTSTGVFAAAKRLKRHVRLLAINHWNLAIETHRANHPTAKHLCMNLDGLDPISTLPSRHLHLLVASPECTGHSRAAGGKPRNEQSRATAFLVLKWLQELRIDNFIIENVPEFRDFGPLGADGKPLRSKKGVLFKKFIEMIEAMNYTVEYRVLTCADYGDATTRERLFILGKRGRNKQIVWPEQTHSRTGQPTLFNPHMKQWVGAKEIIDWSLPSQSVFDRKRPLAENTWRRLITGLERFDGISFILPNEGIGRRNAARLPEMPLNSVTSRGAGHLVQPFVVAVDQTGSNGSGVSPIHAPVPTITTKNRLALAKPFILNLRGGKDKYTRAQEIEVPLQAITTAPAQRLVEPVPFIIGTGGPEYQAKARGVEPPMPTVLTQRHLAIVQPKALVLGQQSDAAARPDDLPIPTVATRGAIRLAQPTIRTVKRSGQSATTTAAEPFIAAYHGSGEDARVSSIDESMPTIDTSNRFALIEPIIIKYNGTGTATSIHLPLPSVTTRDRFALAIPVVQDRLTGAKGIPITLADGTQALLDIRMRMFEPHELAASHSFPKEYKLVGRKRDRVKMVGNSVPVRTAEALALALLGN